MWNRAESANKNCFPRVYRHSNRHASASSNCEPNNSPRPKILTHSAHLDSRSTCGESALSSSHSFSSLPNNNSYFNNNNNQHGSPTKWSYKNWQKAVDKNNNINKNINNTNRRTSATMCCLNEQSKREEDFVQKISFGSPQSKPTFVRKSITIGKLSQYLNDFEMNNNSSSANKSKFSVQCCHLSNSSTSIDRPRTGASNLYKNKNCSLSHHLISTRNSSHILSYFQAKKIEWKKYQHILVDSHCHFDMLLPRIKYQKTMKDYFEEFEFLYLDNFEACVNILCDPSRYSNCIDEQLSFYDHPKVYNTIGCHPHFALSWSNEIEQLIEQTVVSSNGRLVAIGECGLDDSKKNRVNMNVQRRAFSAQLSLAKKLNKPLIIHCRGMEEQVFEMMCESQLSADHPIHLHCFTGGWQMAQTYLAKFSNLCVGVTPLLLTNNASFNPMRELVQNMPLDKLLLETDSPYFVPRLNRFPSAQFELSHPAFVFATAEAVADQRNVSIDHVLALNRNNIRKIYSF